MSESAFETALAGRVEDMLDACTRCGKCVEVCPSVAPAGLAAAVPVDVINGVIDIVRTGTGSDAARTWANACTQTGDCIKACAYGVNPRFLLTSARIAMAKARHGVPERRRDGVDHFRKLARLGHGPQGSAAEDAAGPPPDFVFYTGCNILKTPHIALLALDIMDALGVTYRVMGGPSHCCGIVHMRAGDTEVLGRVANRTVEKLSQSNSGQVLSWCPSCQVQFTETTLPTIERQRGSRPFEMTPFIKFLFSRIDDIRPLLRHRVEARVALHKHRGVAGVMEAAEALLRAVPGVEIVDLGQPGVGLQSVYMAALPEHRRTLQLQELEAARAAHIDLLAAVYHSDHRELCAHERDWPFRIVNLLEIVGASLGHFEDDHYKRLKIMQDEDAILADCRDLIEQHRLDPAEARQIVAGMLRDQPLPLARSAVDVGGGGTA